MPNLATIILVLAVVLALWWKLRCIRRGCSVDRQSDEARRPPPSRYL